MYGHGSGTSCAHAHCTSHKVRRGSCAPHTKSQRRPVLPASTSRPLHRFCHVTRSASPLVKSSQSQGHCALQPAVCCVQTQSPVPPCVKSTFTSTHPRACAWAVQLRMQKITRHAAHTAATAQNQTAAYTHTCPASTDMQFKRQTEAWSAHAGRLSWHRQVHKEAQPAGANMCSSEHSKAAVEFRGPHRTHAQVQQLKPCLVGSHSFWWQRHQALDRTPHHCGAPTPTQPGSWSRVPAEQSHTHLAIEEPLGRCAGNTVCDA